VRGDASPRSFARLAAAAVALTTSMLIGAAAAALVFQAQLSRIVVQWQSLPQPPGAPAPRVPVPLSPPPQPPL
jgi:hypothetical protein